MRTLGDAHWSGLPRKAPERLDQAFDLNTVDVTPREIEMIREALQDGRLVLSPHAFKECINDSIPPQQALLVVWQGKPVKKDLVPGDQRKIGVNFEGKITGNRRICVKIGWVEDYVVTTVYEK